MLNVSKQGTYQDATGYQWTFYQDDVNSSVFYIVPRPQFAFDATGNPIFQIVRYSTDDANNGSGYCHIGVELSVPNAVQAAIVPVIAQQFGVSNPIFNAMSYNPSGCAYFLLTVGGETTTVVASASSFGSNQATFIMHLTKTELDSVQAAFTTAGGTYEVQYNLSVPARLPAVTAVVSFNSAIAYQYQVTQPVHHTWGSDTPGYVNSVLKASGASTVNLTWGIANPPATLVQSVTSWANATLSDMVAAQVKEQMQIQGMTSSESFNINAVSSFTNTFQENQVINWCIQPQQLLPSLTDLKLNIANFTTTVNTQQQVMTVTANLPFIADQVNGSSTNPQFQEMQVQSLSVTVSYPGLPQSQATHTFTGNTSQVFTAPYNTTQGAAWELEYTVTYAGKASPVSATITDIEQGQYTLSLGAAGIFTISFDAQQAFAGTPSTNSLQQVDIGLTFLNSDGSGPFINQTQTIKRTDLPQISTITSLLGVPMTSRYNYTVTYLYANGLSFTAPTQSNQTGFTQYIQAAAAVHMTEVVIVVPASSQDLIIDATVNMWYPQAPDIPGVSGQPTQARPTVFNLAPQQQGQMIYARDTFNGFINGNQPLMYSASINALSGQVDTGPVMVANTMPSVMITSTQRYFTLQVMPTAINWQTASFQSVEVIVTANITGGTSSPQTQTQTMTWNSGDNDPQYMTISIQLGQSVSYDWSATYITAGQTPQQLTGTSSAPILNIPPTPADAPAGVNLRQVVRPTQTQTARPQAIPAYALEER